MLEAGKGSELAWSEAVSAVEPGELPTLEHFGGGLNRMRNYEKKDGGTHLSETPNETGHGRSSRSCRGHDFRMLLGALSGGGGSRELKAF